VRNSILGTAVLEELAPPNDGRLITARKATMRDIPALLGLINSYAAQGIMLPRTEFEMSENVRDFTVAFLGSEFAGCAALHFYTPTSAEIRSLAVTPAAKKQGVGVFLTRELEKEAINNDLHTIFAFTYVADFFRRMGYQQVDRGLLPLKVWKDCLGCPKFQCCDEIAVLKVLRPDPLADLSLGNGSELVQLPTLKRA
jgi:amino-acid N-acetyltransferase